jgi:hypothetical protein
MARSSSTALMKTSMLASQWSRQASPSRPTMWLMTTWLRSTASGSTWSRLAWPFSTNRQLNGKST